jgi:hypothetical protein
LPASRTPSDQVELVPGDLVALLFGDNPGRFRHGPLEARRRGHVLDRPALATGQVVVMAGQLLGQLESAVVVDTGDPPDNAGLNERGDIPVGAALRQLEI